MIGFRPTRGAARVSVWLDFRHMDNASIHAALGSLGKLDASLIESLL